ncbi:MAG: type secretion system lysozyme-related protein [Candidatus Solibacter sp.]|jgi:type VI secretion system protein ImpF|nr:type secretion system lysozyme-related protein [Candidatus Solibacter sp.]
MIVFSVLNRLVVERGSDRNVMTSTLEERGRNAQIVSKGELERYRAAVRSDLEWLLNTRRIAMELPEGLKEVERSLFYYGLPDIAALNLSPTKSLADQERLTALIARTIEIFEPRIINPRVSVDNRRASGVDVHFQISGKLKLKPHPAPVVYDTTLDLNRGQYAVDILGETRA